MSDDDTLTCVAVPAEEAAAAASSSTSTSVAAAAAAADIDTMLEGLAADIRCITKTPLHVTVWNMVTSFATSFNLPWMVEDCDEDETTFSAQVPALALSAEVERAKYDWLIKIKLGARQQLDAIWRPKQRNRVDCLEIPFEQFFVAEKLEGGLTDDELAVGDLRELMTRAWHADAESSGGDS